MLLANDKYEDLSRMYRLFSRVEQGQGLQPMAKIVQQHIEKMGNEVINQREARIEKEGEKDSNQDPTFVRSLLDLHDKFMSVVNQQFEKNASFHKALKEAFVEFVNKDVGKFKNADLMSSFCDRILKKGGEKLSDEEVEDNLEKVRAHIHHTIDMMPFTACVIRRSSSSATCALVVESKLCPVTSDPVYASSSSTGMQPFSATIPHTLIPPVTPHLVSLQVVNLFTYLTDKDLFAEIYRNQLAKRLLNQRSSSDDWEKLMIGKLKHRCGAQFTGKVRRYLSDENMLLGLAIRSPSQPTSSLHHFASLASLFCTCLDSLPCCCVRWRAC
jgi:Ca2+-binding EF-hand superfamily protein